VGRSLLFPEAALRDVDLRIGATDGRTGRTGYPGTGVMGIRFGPASATRGTPTRAAGWSRSPHRRYQRQPQSGLDPQTSSPFVMSSVHTAYFRGLQM